MQWRFDVPATKVRDLRSVLEKEQPFVRPAFPKNDPRRYTWTYEISAAHRAQVASTIDAIMAFVGSAFDADTFLSLSFAGTDDHIAQPEGVPAHRILGRVQMSIDVVVPEEPKSEGERTPLLRVHLPELEGTETETPKPE
jgi:hypothetical protein